MAVVLGLAGVFAKAAILPSAEPSPAATRSAPTVPVPTTPSPSPTPAETFSRSTLVLRGTGDVNLDSNFIPNFRTFGYDYAWSGLKGFFKRDDLTVVNLECPVSRLGSQVLTKDYDLKVQSVTCPDGQEVVPNATFNCTAVVDGDQVNVPVKITSADGNYEVGRPA